MVGLVSSLVLSALMIGKEPCGTPCNQIKTLYLGEEKYSLNKPSNDEERKLYVPQAGDLVFFRDDIFFWKLTYRMAFTGPPYHVAVVIQQPDGEYQLLESGPNDTMHVEICPLQCRFQSWKGDIWVRRRATPLTPEQSKSLTEFAHQQKGKRYALLRLGAQLTVLRTRGPVRTYFVGAPHGERDSYICAECVLESLTKAGVLDGKNVRPSATYPQDMFWDRSYNRFLNHHFHLSPEWRPPQYLTLGD